jgi:hypothetical protein
MLDRKGFLFTVTIFLILTYILLSVSVWVKSVEASERGYSEFYKESTVELAIEQITPAKLDNVTYVIMNRGLLRLNDHSISDPLKAGPVGDENLNIRASLNEILMNGSASASHFHGAALPQESNSSLTAWASNLNSSLKAIGVYINQFQVTDFNVSQSRMDRVDYSFNMTLGIKDYTNTSSVFRTYHIANSIDLNGFVDPALARMSNQKAGDQKTIYRQLFFNTADYADTSTIQITKLGQSVKGGQGWIYGPLAMAVGSKTGVLNWQAITISTRRNYILVGTYDEITGLTADVYDQFAGFILTTDYVPLDNCSAKFKESKTFNPITYKGANCDPAFDYGQGAATGKPFIIAPNFNAANAPVCPLMYDNETNGKCVLMLNKYLESEVSADPAKKLATSGAGLFDVEEIRDFTMCGYYTHNPKAPSYLQHLLNGTYSRNDSAFGIETFVIGNYANDYGVYDTHSRLDRELFNSTITNIAKIRGLPGCRNYGTCADSPLTGIFAVSPDTKADYNLNTIACDNGAAGCNQ